MGCVRISLMPHITLLVLHKLHLMINFFIIEPIKYKHFAFEIHSEKVKHQNLVTLQRKRIIKKLE